MGAYISIGLTYGIEKSENLVYSGVARERVEQELRKLIEYFLDSNGTIKEAKYSEDIDGNSWKEVDLPSPFSFKDYYKVFSNGYYGEILVYSEIMKGEKLDCTIRLNKETEFFGFLLDIKETDLFKSNSYPDEKIDDVTEKLIAVMYHIYLYSKYDYAFCDLEAQFYYPPDVFKNLDDYVYSIAIIPNSDSNLIVTKSDWNIDGHTARKNIEKYTLYHY